MPPTTPPFIPEEFDLSAILESGIGQVGLPLLMGAAPAIFGERGGQVAQGVGAGLSLADTFNQRRKGRQASTQLGTVLRGAGAATPATPGTPATGVPTPPPLTAPSPAVAGSLAQGATGPSPTTTFSLPTPGTPATPGSPALFDPQLAEILATMAESGTAVKDITDLADVLVPPKAKPLDSTTAALRRQQTRVSQAREGLVGQQTKTSAARAERLRQLGAGLGGPLLGESRRSQIIDRTARRIQALNEAIENQEIPPDQVGRAIKTRDALQAQLNEALNIGNTTAPDPDALVTADSDAPDAGDALDLDPAVVDSLLDEANNNPDRALELARERGLVP